MLSLSVPALAEPVAPAADRERAIGCLATAIAYEAGLERVEGQEAVAQVILNRVRSALYPKSVCAVVFAGSTRRTGCQFSFTCDGSLRRAMPPRIMEAARGVAASALDNVAPDRVSGATHYHANYVYPYWAPSLVRITRIGAHVFYRLPGAGDGRGLERVYTPSGEPLVASITGATSGPTQVAAPPASPPPPPARFSPWGLPSATPPAS